MPGDSPGDSGAPTTTRLSEFFSRKPCWAVNIWGLILASLIIVLIVIVVHDQNQLDAMTDRIYKLEHDYRNQQPHHPTPAHLVDDRTVQAQSETTQSIILSTLATPTPTTPPHELSPLNINAIQVYLDKSKVTAAVPGRTSGYVITCGWSDGPDGAFLRDGIPYMNTTCRFRIKVTGDYGAYSHLAFHPSRDSSHPASGIYSQRLMRANGRTTDPDHDEILLDNTEYQNCGDSPGQYCYSNTLTHHPVLREGDEIYIAVLSPELLVGDLRRSIFSLRLLPAR